MKIIIDENIAFAEEAFTGLREVRLLNGRAITNSEVRDADILIVRSITRVDENLLRNSKVRFVGTATIGTDHIDWNYLKDNNIDFADAKGSNADSVAEYVFTALFKVASEKNISLKKKTIGVVGIGNIGSRVVRIAQSLGIKVLKNDPPLERKGVGQNYVPLNEILKADIISFHVPLNMEGTDQTYHLIDHGNLKKIKPGTTIINTSRGPVINNNALLDECLKKDLILILDVWENEPLINIKLLEKTLVGTTHIAGYSFEGKVNGTKMIYDSLCRFLNVESEWKPKLPNIEQTELELPTGETDKKRVFRLLSSIYDIERDDSKLREIIKYETKEQGSYFDMLRKGYPVRREFNNYIVRLSKREYHLRPVLESLRFKVKIC